MTQDPAALLWTGKPKQGLMVAGRDVLMIPFSLVWCGFAVFWTYMATSHGAPVFFTAWGLMFVTFGLYFVVGRFIHDAVIRARITYAVGAAGITITRGGTRTTIPAGQWSCIEMTTYGDGTGTIRFAPQEGMYGRNGFGMWVPILEKTPQFYRIAEPERVLGIINGLALRVA